MEGEGKKHRRTAVRTRKVEVADRRQRDLDEVEELTRKHGLDVGDVRYASTYARLVCLAPTVAQVVPAPRAWASSPNMVTATNRETVTCQGYSLLYRIHSLI